MDEFERIEALRARLPALSSGVNPSMNRGVSVGVGDDAAVLLPSARAQVISVDSSVADVHFRWPFGPAATLMERAVTAALSDLAAMGSEPRAVLSAMVLGPDVDDARFLELADGLATASRRYDVPVIGGNLSRGPTTSFTTTVIGQSEGRVPLRSSAEPGQALFVTGPLGGAALGLQVLLRGDDATSEDAAFVEAWLRPTARLDLSPNLARAAQAAIDISDGLLQDLGHLCRASGVCARLEFERLPLPAQLMSRAAQHGLDGAELAMTGGEDYEVLFTAAPGADLPWAVKIGEITGPDPHGTVTATRAGEPVSFVRPGFGHFSVATRP